MTTISEFINKNESLFIKATALEYLVFGTFPNDFLNNPISVLVSQKKGGLILKINNGKIVIMINNFKVNIKGGKKTVKKKNKSRKNKKRTQQKGGNNILIALLVLLIGCYLKTTEIIRFLQPESFDFRELQHNPWEVSETNVDKLFRKVVPEIKLQNTNLTMDQLNNSLTRALTSNNTEQIAKLPRNMTLKPLSYAEFNITRFPAHTEIVNMFKNISIPNRTYMFGHRTVDFKVFGTWNISKRGYVNIELLEDMLDMEGQGPHYTFPNREDVDRRILNFVTETIQIQKKIGMIKKGENEGQFRFILSSLPPRKESEETNFLHYDGLGSTRDISEKAYSGRNPHIGGIVSLIYPEAMEISQPSITVDEEGNPIPDPRQTTKHGERMPRHTRNETKYIEGSPTTGQVQMHDQSQGVLHETTGKALIRRRLLNLQILPISINDAPFSYLRKRKTIKGGEYSELAKETIRKNAKRYPKQFHATIEQTNPSELIKKKRTPRVYPRKGPGIRGGKTKKKKGGHHLYKTLGVSKYSTQKQIRRRYKKLKKNKKLTKKIKHAYKILSNKKSRKMYNNKYKKYKK